MKDLLQSSTQEAIVFGPMVSSSDHITAVTGISPTVTISKNGGSFASPSGAVTEVGNGFYKIAGNATDTNTLGPLIVHATGTGADVFDERFQVVAVSSQLANVPANVTQWKGSTPNDLIQGKVDSLQQVRTGTAQAGAAASITLDSGASASDSFYKGCWIAILAGTGAGQSRLITTYVGSTKVATVGGNWITNPDNTSVFVVIPASQLGVNWSDVIGQATTVNLSNTTLSAVTVSGMTSVMTQLVSSQILIVTGATSPAFNGTYAIYGAAPITNGKLAYVINGVTNGSGAIWWDGTQWIMSLTAGSNGTNYWKSTGDETGPWINGGGTTTGSPVVTPLKQPPSGKNPTLATVDASGRSYSDMRSILGTALTESVAGYLAAAFKKLFDVATPVFTMASVNQSADNDTKLSTLTTNYTATRAGKLDNLDATISSRSTLGGTAQSGDAYAIVNSGTYGNSAINTKLGDPSGASVSADIAAVKSDTAGTKAKTDNLPSDPADESLIIDATNAIMNRLGSPSGASVSADIATTNAALTDGTNGLPAIKTAVSSVPAAVWNYLTSAMTTVNSIGKKLATLVVGTDGSVQAEVDSSTIAQDVVDALGATPPTLISAFNQDGSRLTLVRGNDYSATNGASLKFNISGLTEAVGTKAKLQLNGVAADVIESATINSATQEVVLGDLLAAATLQLTASKQPQPYTIDFVTSGGLRRSFIEGLMYVKDSVGT